MSDYHRMIFCSVCGNADRVSPFGDKDNSFWYPGCCEECGADKYAHTTRVARHMVVDDGRTFFGLFRKTKVMWELLGSESPMYDMTKTEKVLTPNIRQPMICEGT